MTKDRRRPRARNIHRAEIIRPAFGLSPAAARTIRSFERQGWIVVLLKRGPAQPLSPNARFWPVEVRYAHQPEAAA